jgi:hypothetical protein
MTQPQFGARGTDSLSPARQGSRRTQPYRKHKKHRPKGQTLSAMLKGAPVFLPNPQDQKRAFQKRMKRGR